MIREAAVSLVILATPSLALAQSNAQSLSVPANGQALSLRSAAYPTLLETAGNQYADKDAAPVALQAVAHKEPLVAGVASWILPGAGSFYAGNNRHGVIHAGAALLSLVVMVGGATSCANDIYGDCSSSLGIASVGYLGYLVNDVWSIFTAVGDANQFNAKNGAAGGHVVGELFVNPGLDVRPTTTAIGTEARVGVRLMSWKF